MLLLVARRCSEQQSLPVRWFGVERVGCQRNTQRCLTIYLLTILAFDSLRVTLDNNRRFSLIGYNSTVFFIRSVSFSRPSISPLRTYSLSVCDRCHVRPFPNIQRKDRRDMDDSLGLSALTLRWYICIDETVGKFWHRVPLQQKNKKHAARGTNVCGV